MQQKRGKSAVYTMFNTVHSCIQCLILYMVYADRYGTVSDVVLAAA
jgi:hypothetical protein